MLAAVLISAPLILREMEVPTRPIISAIMTSTTSNSTRVKPPAGSGWYYPVAALLIWPVKRNQSQLFISAFLVFTTGLAVGAKGIEVKITVLSRIIHRHTLSPMGSFRLEGLTYGPFHPSTPPDSSTSRSRLSGVVAGVEVKTFHRHRQPVDLRTGRLSPWRPPPCQ